MSDITLSLGGKWLQATADREKQGQLIAHLTNQLEALKAAYTEDLENVAKNKQFLVKLQADLEKAETERDEWHSAYNGIKNKAVERDFLVEDMLSQLKTLEVTTRNEELRANEADKRATMVTKEKEVVMEKLVATRKELDETYTKLAKSNDELATATDSVTTLTAALQAMTRSRDSKETQVISLLKEKQRLFRLVTDLRSTIKVAGGSLDAKVGVELDDAVNGESEPSSKRSSYSSKRRSLDRFQAANSTNSLLASTISGTADRQRWATGSQSKNTTSKSKSISNASDLDDMSLAGSIANLSFSASSSTRGSKVASATTTPRSNLLSSSRRGALSTQDLEDEKDEDRKNASSIASRSGKNDDSEDEESRPIETPADQRTVVAKKNLIMRLKKQIELLEEKNKELEKTVGLTRSENQLLLVRFRGAHDRRILAEKKLKQAEKELSQLTNSGSNTPQQQQSASHHSEYPQDEVPQIHHLPHSNQQHVSFHPQHSGSFYDSNPSSTQPPVHTMQSDLQRRQQQRSLAASPPGSPPRWK